MRPPGLQGAPEKDEEAASFFYATAKKLKSSIVFKTGRTFFFFVFPVAYVCLGALLPPAGKKQPNNQTTQLLVK